MATEIIPLLVLVGIVLSIAITAGNYILYKEVFKSDKKTSITNKTWFRALVVPFIYLPGLNVIGFLILLYLRAMKTLNIN